jgi:hypothetical protein
MADGLGTSTPLTNADLNASVAAFTNPIYQAFSDVWRKLAYVREGTGGFLDGTNLVAHPREWEDHQQDNPVKPTKKLKARRNLACYENIASTIIDAKKSTLFREAPSRRVGPDAEAQRAGGFPIQDWWEDVDGSDASMDDFLQRAWDAAGTFGHVVLYFDRPAGAAGATAADAVMPFVRIYTPLDVLDWIVDDRGIITKIKFQEIAPRENFTDQGNFLYRVRIVDETSWALYDQKTGTFISKGEHQLGCLPIVFLFAQRRPLNRYIGQSVLGDPGLYYDVYNLTSEVRELLRNQTFSWLNVPLGSGDQAISVETAKDMLGTAVGTSNVLFSGLQAQMLTADSSNVTVYQEEIARRLRTIYRLAGIQWEADSKDAEAKGSLALKREDMNTRLAAYADELEKAEYALACLFYRSRFGADRGDDKLEADQVYIRYPDTFDVTPFESLLEQAQAALSLGMPTEFLKELRKTLVSKFLPDLPTDVAETIQKAIEDAAPDLTPEQRMQQRLTAAAAGFATGDKPKIPSGAAGAGKAGESGAAAA